MANTQQGYAGSSVDSISHSKYLSVIPFVLFFEIDLRCPNWSDKLCLPLL